MFHGDDYISRFVPFFDIPVSLGSLFQRIASIYWTGTRVSRGVRIRETEKAGHAPGQLLVL
jgi:hypothetical protein